MAKQIVAVFLMCIVVLAAVHVREAEAQGEFKSCFTTCHKECQTEGNGSTFCEMKCDSDCTAKEVASKLNLNISP